MNMAFDGEEIIEISGDTADAIRSYLTEDTDDKVLDLEIFEEKKGMRCIAVAIQTISWGKTVVEGAIILVSPEPDSGENMYSISGINESEGPVASYCPQRILDLLTPTDSDLALDWRERCRERLVSEMGEAVSTSMN